MFVCLCRRRDGTRSRFIMTKMPIAISTGHSSGCPKKATAFRMMHLLLQDYLLSNRCGSKQKKVSRHCALRCAIELLQIGAAFAFEHFSVFQSAGRNVDVPACLSPGPFPID